MRLLIALGLLVVVTHIHVCAQPSPSLAPEAALIKADNLEAGVADDLNYVDVVSPPSPADNEGLPLCETATFPIYPEDLVNLPENDCDSNGLVLPYARNQAFGISWTDDSPANCSTASVTIIIQAGFSCSGDFGSTFLNQYETPSPFRFPFENEYDEDCTCAVPESPLQVFNFRPHSAYNQSGFNTFMITNSTGSNGLRGLVPYAINPLFGLVITNQWVPADSLNIVRTRFAYAHTQSDTVLAVGGITLNQQVTNTADEYFPVADSWTPTRNNMTVARQSNELAALNERDNPLSGSSYFLITAGGVDQTGTVLSSAEIYNTSSRLWSSAPPMKTARERFTLTPIFNGTRSALAVGGLQGSLAEFTALASIEAYTWDGNNWTPVGNLTQARYRHQTVILKDWSALVMGGQGANQSALSSVESISLDSGNVTQKASMSTARYAFTATVLQNGSVLVVGGAQLPNSESTWDNSQLLASCELYVNGTWYPSSNLTYPRAGHQAVRTGEGGVLVVGGGGTTAQTASELWDNRTGNWVTVAPLPSPKINFGVARLQDSRVLAFGGSPNSSVTNTNGTSSSYMYTQPFSFSDAAPFFLTNASGLSPSPAPALNESYRAPPIVRSPTAPPYRNTSANSVFGWASLPPNTSIQIFVDDGLSGGAIGGIVAGAVGFLLLVMALVIFLLYKRRKRRRARRYTAENLERIQKRYGSSDLGSGQNGIELQSSGIAASVMPMNGETTRLRGAHTQKSMLSSPFGGASGPVTLGNGSASNGANGGAGGGSHESVELPRALLPSPFGMETGLSGPRTATTLTTLKSIDETTSTTGGSGTLDTHGSHVPLTTLPAEHSTRSDLSRVSIAIRQELSAADWKIERDALILDRRLGKGGFGEVFRAQHHGSPVAVKVLQIRDDRTMLDACCEFGHLHNLRHSKLVVSYGACIDGMNLMLVMELMEEDLFHAIANDTTGSGDSVLWNFRGWQIAVDVASALVFLHSKGLLHLDVKSLNILLKGRRTEAKLGDLGLAKLIPDGHLALQHTLPGTPAYSAPEVVQAQLSWRLRTQGRRDQFHTQVGTPADIFSFGVVLFEICTGQHPARWRQDFDGTFRTDQAPAAIAKLVDDCLNDEPELRPTARQVLDLLLANKPKHLR